MGSVDKKELTPLDWIQQPFRATWRHSAVNNYRQRKKNESNKSNHIPAIWSVMREREREI